jgi:hypothetical protein
MAKMSKATKQILENQISIMEVLNRLLRTGVASSGMSETEYVLHKGIMNSSIEASRKVLNDQ